MTGKAKMQGILEYLKDILLNNVKFVVFAHHKEVAKNKKYAYINKKIFTKKYTYIVKLKLKLIIILINVIVNR